ncbi:uncharacterized protein [Diadema setosum]|uniref:uncharacterized protein n=1 Tax=Diadema setosum TaxID=31175 RepID=UPI003B3B874A
MVDDTFFHRREGFCCGNTIIHFSDSEHNELKCCQGSTPYNDTTQVCCGAQVRPAGHGVECCGESTYNSNSQACCPAGPSNILQPFDISPTSRHDCCGNEGPYDPNSELCCKSGGGEAVIRHVGQTSITESQCCGLNVINSVDTMCCNGVQRQRNPFYECCGSEIYNVSAQVCSGGRVFDIGTKGHAKLCGETPYNPDNQHCCGGEVHDIGHGACCARAGAYNPNSQHCCRRINDIPYIGGITKCCGRESYLESSHVCCGEQLYKRASGVECCANVMYNTSTQLCCGSAVVEKSSENDQCCGLDSYNPLSQTCCGGSVKAGMGECCYVNSEETQLYNSKTETCCQAYDPRSHRVTGQVHGRGQARDKCCGIALLEEDQLCTSENVRVHKKSPNDNAVCETNPQHPITYNTTTEICTREGVLMKPDTPQCLGRSYNNETSICCHGHLHFRMGQDTECCSVLTYNSRSQSCFLDMVFDVNPMYAHPCGDKLFDNRTHMCYQNFLIRDRSEALEYPEVCGVTAGALIPYRPDQHECCRDKLIGAGLTCCDGSSWYTPGTALTEGACCPRPDGHSVGYNSQSQLCCNGHIHPRNGQNVQCCGDTTYDNSEDLCCDGNLYKREGQDLICTGGVAHLHAEIVCDGVKHAVRPNGVCCGRSLINSVSQICCQGVGYEKTSPDMKCCGRVPYSDTEKLCCETSLFNIGSKSECCGSSSYDPTTHTCHKLRGESFLFRDANHADPLVCEEGNYDVTRHTCCDGLLHLNVVNGQCCGVQVVHNPDTHLCCNGRIHRKQYSDTGCCGGNLYNSNIYTCCGGKTLWQYSQLFQCCRDNITSITEPCN